MACTRFESEADTAAVKSKPWIFGYGSLMWRPGFAYLERTRARLHGRRRAFCIYSVHHRGTPQKPGLVLGLAPGGSVLGVAYRIDPSQWSDVIGYLRDREQPTETYVEAQVRVRLETGAEVAATTFLSDTTHPQWAGVLSLEAQASLIAFARGQSGANIDYLKDLVAHLRDEGLQDHIMTRLLRQVGALEADPQASS